MDSSLNTIHLDHIQQILWFLSFLLTNRVHNVICILYRLSPKFNHSTFSASFGKDSMKSCIQNIKLDPSCHSSNYYFTYTLLSQTFPDEFARSTFKHSMLCLSSLNLSTNLGLIKQFVTHVPTCLLLKDFVHGS